MLPLLLPHCALQTSGYEDGVSKDEAEEGEVEDLVKEMAEQVIKVRQQQRI